MSGVAHVGKPVGRRRSRSIVGLAGVVGLLLGATGIAHADDISNDLDATVDAVAEVMSLNVGGANGSTQLYVVARNSDGKNGCNLTGSTTLVVEVGSSNPAVATVSPSSVTFGSCDDSHAVTVAPVATGEASIILSQISNSTSGTFNLTPATFTVNVAPPANTAPSIDVDGVDEGATYSKGSVPTATCEVTDAEDGSSSFAATVSAVSGPAAGDGIGSQTASCSYTDSGGLIASASESYSIVDPSAPAISYVLSPPAPDGGNSWYTSDVTLAWTVSELESPSSLQTTGCVDQSITNDQSNDNYSCSATSAGGSSGPVSVNIQRDATPPSLTWVGGPDANGTYYDFELPAAPTCTADDGLSGPDGCAVTGYSAGVGGHVLTATAHDAAGNETTETRSYTVVQSSAPVVQVALDPDPANGSNGWYKSGPVSIDWTVTGDPSPIALDCDDLTVSDDQAKTDYTCTASNAVGIDSKTVNIGLDSTAPELSWVGGPADEESYYDFEVPAAPTCTADDDLSGPDGCTVTGYSAGVGGHVLTATAHDAAGNETVETRSYTVLASAPAGVDVSVDPPAPNGSNGWYTTGPVSIDWTVEGKPTPTTAGCDDVTISADQPKTPYTCSAGNPVGDDSETVTIGLDSTDPTIEGSRTPPANGNGWNNTDVTVSFECDDTLSDVDTCEGDTTLNGEGAGQSVTGTATDQAGNTATATVSDISIDKTAPTITGAPDRQPNDNGWYDGAVTITFSCGDALSGVESCPEPVVLSSNGAGQSVAGTATDRAGNTATASVSGIDIDTTAPTIVGAPDRAPNANGWYDGDVTVSFECDDALSGIDSCPEPVILSSDGAGQSVAGTATDAAGNSASATVSGINIDKTAPTISGVAAPSPNGNGWNNTDVEVTFICSDALSGVVAGSCGPDETVTVEGDGLSVTGTVTDLAGNTASATVSDIDIDKTAPTISGLASPAANSNGWNNTDVAVTFTCSDALSGVDSCPPPQVISTEGAGQSATGTATDRAGNSASATVSGIDIDKSAPTVALVGGPVDGASYYFGSAPAAPTCTASDALSGLDGACSVSGYSTVVGTHTVTATAMDEAGNSASVSASYTVLAWTVGGFYQPVDMNGVLNVVKAGSTVPLKFQVFAGATELTDTSVVSSFMRVTVNCADSNLTESDMSDVTTTGGTVLRYDATGGQFIQNWKTPTSRGTCHKVTMTADDGSTIIALFKLK